MTTYSVQIDTVEVWSLTTDSYEGVSLFPSEYVQRPTTGFEVHLLIDNVVIGVQRLLTDEPPLPEEWT